MGWRPQQDQILLTSGDWLYARRNPTGPFPPGTVIEIHWQTGEVWPGTIAADVVSWQVESAVAAAIAHGTPFEITVAYPRSGGGTVDYVWRYGHALRIPQP